MKRIGKLLKAGMLLIIAAMLVQLVPIVAFANGNTFELLVKDDVVLTGSGTEEDPYQIQSADDLLWISTANSLYDGFSGKHFKQTEDIDMSSVINFNPIGDADIPFKGIYDGNNHKISNLMIEGTEFAGLFGFIDASGELRNLILEDTSIKAIDCKAAGGAAAVNLGTIQGIHMTVSSAGKSLISVSGKKGIVFGCVVGYNEGTVLQSSNQMDLIIDDFQDDYYTLGGIAGENYGLIENCFNTGNISVEESEVSRIALGGIVSLNYTDGAIQYCYNTGVLTINNEAEETYIGGIAAATISYLFNDNFYLQEAADYGFWYFDGETEEFEHFDTGAERKSIAQLKDTSTFADWDTAIWTIDSGMLPQLLNCPAHYTVTYNGNISTGGTAPEYGNKYIKGETITVLGNTGNLVKTGYTFDGWNTKSDGSGTSYTEGMSFLMGPADVTLYAKWTTVSSGHNSSRNSHQDPPSNNVSVTVGDQTQQQAATGTTQTRDGRTVTTVALDAQKMTELVNSSQKGSSVTIPVTGKPDIAVGELDGQLVKAMENKQAVLEIKTDDAIYTLPAQQINIDAISSRLGQTVNLSDIKVSIEIAKYSDEAVKVVEDSASKGDFSIVVLPIDFTVKCNFGDQTINVSRFSSYVERTVAIPDGVDPQKITTGVVVEQDGTLRHVPTKIIVIDGKYYARINSLTNSAYSVVWNPIDFKDAAAHWAKEAINEMGSRMVIGGIGNGTFQPDRDITRAEFAAVIVRALGLKPELGQKSFSDVPADAWYSSYVTTASEYRIISGYGNGKFGPNDKITREQAMVMIARAMNITELKVEFNSGEAEKVLEGYKDAEKFADYARNSIAACIKTGIATGKGNMQIAPKDSITRAEVAVIIQRLLQKSNLI